jgi:hypothetical protein
MAVHRASVLALLLLAVVPSCTETSNGSAPSGSTEERPWERPFVSGNFAINTGEVLTNEDGVSASRINDYVLESALPGANFEVFTVHAYLPSTAEIEPTVTAARVTVARVDGSSTGDIHQGHERVERTTLGGETYTVFRVTGFTVAEPPITRATFANVVFELDVRYEDDGRTADSGTKTVEIYKR